jgi:hypothetical protein
MHAFDTLSGHCESSRWEQLYQDHQGGCIAFSLARSARQKRPRISPRRPCSRRYGSWTPHVTSKAAKSLALSGGAHNSGRLLARVLPAACHLARSTPGAGVGCPLGCPHCAVELACLCNLSTSSTLTSSRRGLSRNDKTDGNKGLSLLREVGWLILAWCWYLFQVLQHAIESLYWDQPLTSAARTVPSRARCLHD